MVTTIITSEAKCRDCYKCIRHCPVKAIGINDDQAKVVEEKCILCGKCVSICPQQAKTSSSNVDIFDKYLKTNQQIAVSIAPSYLGATEYTTPWKLLTSLRKLGVDIIEETAIAAGFVSKEYYRLHQKNTGIKESIISSCCPTIISLITKEYPELLECVAPIKSPMLIHAELFRKKLGDEWKIVFIGPCFAKKKEANCIYQDNSIDLVLDFAEIINYISNKDCNPDKLEDSYPDSISHRGRKYPLERGILSTAGLEDSILSDVVSISGLDAVQEVLNDLQNGLIKPSFIELLACRGGCIGGPAMGNSLGITARKKRISSFVGDYNVNEKIYRDNELDKRYDDNQDIIDREYNFLINNIKMGKFHPVEVLNEKEPDEKEIRKILRMTGKNSVDDETNCGGCGYNSCREKAIAVFRGLAKVEMCVPYMREKAESLSHAVVDSSVNGIIIVNEEMIIQEFNPAAYLMFNRKNIKAKGEHLQTFIDPTDYKKVWNDKKRILDKYKKYEQYDLITRENIYPLKKYGVVIGLVTDVTAEQKRKSEINTMKMEALEKAEKVINKQMKAAQEIAGLLGESTAETKVTLLELVDIMNRKEAGADGAES